MYTALNWPSEHNMWYKYLRCIVYDTMVFIYTDTGHTVKPQYKDTFDAGLDFHIQNSLCKVSVTINPHRRVS